MQGFGTVWEMLPWKPEVKNTTKNIVIFKISKNHDFGAQQILFTCILLNAGFSGCDRSGEKLCTKNVDSILVGSELDEHGLVH